MNTKENFDQLIEHHNVTRESIVGVITAAMASPTCQMKFTTDNVGTTISFPPITLEPVQVVYGSSDVKRKGYAQVIADLILGAESKD